MSEQERREAQIREWMAKQGLDALLLRRASSFAWATCGASSYINTATDYGEGMLLYTPDARYVVANNIEAPRLREEEGLGGHGWEFLTHDWFGQSDTVARLTHGARLGADGPFPGAEDVSSDVSRLRSLLSPEEGERFRALGRLCAEAMSAAIQQVRPGQTEYEIAGLLARETASRGAWPIVDLVATD
ncbi:MAG: aminopeptidase P family N-terminal domain-containing protein, partial [Chloroflexota bacterium]|nr:aminopeptidase P family N-terminal domain-containing protein [Chloroflexota bacterium]